MRFRTEIGPLRGGFAIGHDDRIVLLGSCFADNVGERLRADGFDAVHNPLGPLYNPASVLRVLDRGARPYGAADFTEHEDGWHCLDFASRYRADRPGELARKVNADYLPLAAAIERATVLIVTFGTTGVFTYGPDDIVAGNCHKLPATFFGTRDLRLDEIADMWAASEAVARVPKLIFTVSPVRYVSRGLAAGALSKAVLRVAVDDICRRTGADYFPAFEILNDDLRDYRFYADDLKHPSSAAAEYIYEAFGGAYFSRATAARAAEYRREYLRLLHRPIITD